MFPQAVPRLVFGLALLWAWLNIPIPIYGTLWLLALAYFTVLMPLGVRTLAGVVLQIDKSLEECARVCGASWGYQLRTVTMPLLRPGIVAAWLLLFIASVRELGVSIFLVGPNAKVIAPSIVSAWLSSVDRIVGRIGDDPDAASCSWRWSSCSGAARRFTEDLRERTRGSRSPTWSCATATSPRSNGVSFTVGPRRARDPARPLGLRQDHDLARHRRARGAVRRQHPHRRPTDVFARPSGATSRPRSAACRWCSSPMRCGRI